MRDVCTLYVDYYNNKCTLTQQEKHVVFNKIYSLQSNPAQSKKGVIPFLRLYGEIFRKIPFVNIFIYNLLRNFADLQVCIYTLYIETPFLKSFKAIFICTKLRRRCIRCVYNYQKNNLAKTNRRKAAQTPAKKRAQEALLYERPCYFYGNGLDFKQRLTFGDPYFLENAENTVRK